MVTLFDILSSELKLSVTTGNWTRTPIGSYSVGNCQ